MSVQANRLAQETSPYLLQHAHNPVEWYPWGEEAFERARREDKLVLVSIGYAACHWCHVMERESFEDPETARVMNDLFVNVKVDREERPDVDAIYMDAVQAMTGHGGWPMTVFCTPDAVPVIGGTYFPPEDRHGLPGFKRLLVTVANLWETRREDLLRQGTELVRRISASTPRASTEPLSDALLIGAVGDILQNHDPVHGGFGGAPKFPQAPVLELLLRADGRFGTTREPVERTLRSMALGGIYDQLGGGFARYSVDAAWLVPHFEKMLYDNAQLARVYTHAWQRYGDDLYRRIATETLEYMLRDLHDARGGFHSDARGGFHSDEAGGFHSDARGGFHSSEDADSEGEEGKFYVWSYDEFTATAPEAAAYYGVSGEGNFEGANILTAADDEPPTAARLKLFEARERRVRPAKDDKVLTSWNGLTISALARAGAAFSEQRFLEAAGAAAGFLLEEMRTPSGRLLHTYRAGRAKVTGLLEDYAYLAEGLLDLWEATFEPRWLEASLGLAEESLDLFADPDGGFFTAGHDHERLVVRQKEITESATPSPGGVLAQVLQRLAHMFDRPGLAGPATEALRVARIYIDRAPQAVPTWLGALDFHLSPPKEIALTGPVGSERGQALLGVVTRRYLPNRVIAARSHPGDGILDEVALLRDKPLDDEPTAYVCERYVCLSPTSQPEELARQLGS